jgi:hypothetical protein
MNDISKTIEGYYTLLRELTGVEKRELDIQKDIPHKFLSSTGEGDYQLASEVSGPLEDYISKHMADVSANAKSIDQFAVKVPLDKTKFCDFFENSVFYSNEDGTSGLRVRNPFENEKGHTWTSFLLNADTGYIGGGINVALYDGKGDWSNISEESLANPEFNAVRVSAWTPCFISNYEARMEELQQAIGILTGEVEGIFAYYSQLVKK